MTEKTVFSVHLTCTSFLPPFSVMMPASLHRKRTKTSPKYEQTEATYFFIITKISPKEKLHFFICVTYNSGILSKFAKKI